MKIKKFKKIFFFKKTNVSSLKFLKNKRIINQKFIKNIFFFIINFFFKKNSKNQIFIMFLNLFLLILNFLLIKNNNSNIKYSYYFFIKKNFSLNKWFLNFNTFFLWIFFNYEILFFFKKNNSNLKKKSFLFFYIIKKKRKKIFLKWIKNKINFILKNNLFLKYITFFLELILNFKKSTFFNFKNAIYKSIILK